MDGRIKVLVVDDSAFVRKVLTEKLALEEDIEVVGSAPDPFVARDRILELNPDIITLDIEMPRMDGISFLKRLMLYHPMPVIIVSSLTRDNSALVLEALSLGAVDVMSKPNTAFSIGELSVVLADKIRGAFMAGTPSPAPSPAMVRAAAPPRPAGHVPKVVAVGASTGGTRAIEALLLALPADCPPMVIVQHMPELFTGSFAERLNDICAMEVREASDGDAVCPGRVIIARGDYHLLLRRGVSGYHVEVKNGPLVSRHRPSVDVLFKSAARAAGRGALGVIMTGMGRDGAAGMRMMHDSGAVTIAESEQSCVVFGMPREAIAAGGVDHVVHLNLMAQKIMELA